MNKGLLTVAVFMSGFYSYAAQSVMIGEDDFDGTATYLSRTFTAANTASLTWAVVNRTTANDWILDTSKYLADGSAGDGTDSAGFLQSTKTDSFFGLYRGGVTAPRTLTYTFDIAGYTNLNLAMDWVATGDIVDPGITMTASIDGGSDQSIFVIGTKNEAWTETMEDGRTLIRNRSASTTVNGVAAAALTDVFQTYNPTIAGAGSVLTLTLTMSSGVGGPAYGMDNLKLYGTSMNATRTLGLYFISSQAL